MESTIPPEQAAHQSLNLKKEAPEISGAFYIFLITNRKIQNT